jgi:hypothetical protein
VPWGSFLERDQRYPDGRQVLVPCTMLDLMVLVGVDGESGESIPFLRPRQHHGHGWFWEVSLVHPFLEN